ncbi:MAG TPA: TolC family protein [Steroidobacteraceae bacterium]|nr:TolC family protein [Steroidobacteraceae bacterium]
MRDLWWHGSGGRWCAGLAFAALAACAAVPPPAPLEPQRTLDAFSARRLESLAGLPPPQSGWDRAQWLTAALELNPRLAEQRSEVAAVAAAERTAAQIPNPNMELFGEYLKTAGESAAWLYGVSMDFLLQRPGERSRLRRQAALQTALAQSQLSDSIWEVRATLREALLEVVSAQAQGELLSSLVQDRQSLLESDRARLRAGDLGRGQLLSDEVELTRATQRAQAARARAADARARLAAVVGVPLGALESVPVRWPDWQAIGQLTVPASGDFRHQALIARPQIVGALRAYDLAELDLQNEVARRWPQVHIQPAYAWGGRGVQEDALDRIASESALGVSFELPIFNQHQGPIGEAVGRRSAAGEHLKAVQAAIYGDIDRAELAWPTAQRAWEDTGRLAELADQQHAAQRRALASGAGDRAELLGASIAATEAHLALLEAAYTAQQAYGGLEDAYRRPLQGSERTLQFPSEPGT